ncbi:peptidase M3 [Chelativorans sp. ZYF759]|uniref:M3 family metallopeptidase n=1 Tax=Chelativorans sp. ZYF759 TaxID=2692213 RepID=UPI00145F127E|nr:M3 family metallopeptidase [Chelativorans sp. ZYF759]NMG37999.1 peptidase M3 [Chelativorans sp. ZYF759]
MTNHSEVDFDANPLTSWGGPHGLPAFEQLSEDDFAATIEAALEAHAEEIDRIAQNPAAPDIDNTLAALELAGKPLGRASAIFWVRAGAHTSDTIQALERKLSPLMARHFSAIHMNEALFARIDALYDNREALGLDAETDRVLEKTWKRFVKAGARLGAEAKNRLAAINEELAGLGTQFGQNVLADEKNWAVFIDEADLDGLPEFVRDSMAEAAASRGQEGRFAITLSRSIYEPFMAFSTRSDLREQAFRGFTGRGRMGGESDNAEIVARTLKLRAEKARLLGYDTYADLKLEDTMAKTPDAVMGLLEPVWEKAVARAEADAAEMRSIAAGDGHNRQIEAWDWRHFAEKLRLRKHDFDEGQLKPYLKLDNVIAASFDVAGRLFGLSFEEKSGIPAWHEDVRVFEVRNADGSHRAMFLADYFNRPTKRSGAWMTGLQSGHRLGDGQSPIIVNVMNFAKPAKGQAALLSMDEARTLFHEFGHALHGMLSDVTWPSISGTSVARDFVELPSQLYEHWLTVPDIIRTHAVHHRTGEPMPQALLDKMLAARNSDAGFATVEFAASALVDMAYHAAAEPPADPLAFEAETLERLGMPAAIAMRHATPHFLHVFSGEGYSAGYYSYMWSEVLDADAFAAFEETGDHFDAQLAEKLRRHIYSAGGSRDPEELYIAFRGRLPSPEAMMEKRGLA